MFRSTAVCLALGLLAFAPAPASAQEDEYVAKARATRDRNEALCFAEAKAQATADACNWLVETGISNDLARARLSRARVHMGRGFYTNAAVDFDKSGMAAEAARARQAAENIKDCADSADNNRRIAACSWMISNFPDHPKLAAIYLIRGAYTAEMGRLDDAIRDLERAVELGDSEAPATLQKARAMKASAAPAAPPPQQLAPADENQQASDNTGQRYLDGTTTGEILRTDPQTGAACLIQDQPETKNGTNYVRHYINRCPRPYRLLGVKIPGPGADDSDTVARLDLKAGSPERPTGGYLGCLSDYAPGSCRGFSAVDIF